MKVFMQDFKKFVMKGNVVDLAVGLIIGTAFGKIVSSLVNDIVMPPIGMLMGKTNFAELKIVLVPNPDAALEVAIKYGAFIQTVIDFLLIGLSVFLLIKLLNKLKKKEETKPAPAPAPSAQEVLLTEIRDILKKR